MTENADIFQVDHVLMSKLNTTPLRDYVEVYTVVNNTVLKSYPATTI